MKTRLLLYDEGQREWVVHDGAVHDGEFQELHLGCPYAVFRIFDLAVPRERRIYAFGNSHPHVIDGPSLERQFREARSVRQPNGED